MARGENLGDAVLKLRTDDSGFDRGVDRAQKKAERLGKTFDAVGAAAQRIGRNLTLFLTAPILGIGAASVKTASDVQEMRNLFRETFEGSSDDVEAWAARMAEAMNRSRFELMRTAADFAAFLKPLGVAPEAIVPMSEALTALTTDMSSFRNLAEEEVFTRLFSGLAGETEAVRRLGIDIGQAAIEQELLSLGINKTATEATQAEKVMARFSLIMRQTSDAQGDAVRTADSFENQARALGATLKDIRVEVGQRFLPIATRAAQQLRNLGRRFLGLSDNVQAGIIAITAVVAIIGPAILALGLLTQAIGFAIRGFALFGPVIRFAWLAIKGFFIAIQAALVAFTVPFATLPGIIITSLAAIVGGFFIFKDTLVGFFRGLVLAIRDEFVAGFNNKVVRPFQEAMNAIVGFLPESVVEFLGLQPIEVNDIIDNSFTDDMQAVIAAAVENGKREFEAFKTTAVNAVNVVRTRFGEIKTAVADFLPDLELADFTLENLGKGFNDLIRQFDALRSGMGGIVGAADDAAGKTANAFAEAGGRIRNSIEDNLTDALRRVQSFGDAARAIINAVIEGLIRSHIVQPLVGLLPIPGFQHGGRPPVGRAAVVGERGPELFVPDRPGTILPDTEFGAMGGIRQEFNFPLAFPPQLEAFVRNVAGPAGREAAVALLRARGGRF